MVSYTPLGDDGLKLFRMAIFASVIVLVCTVNAYGLTIVDAGHGGADGGAVSCDGTAESPINLAISKKVVGLLQFLGQETLETRVGEDIDYPSDCNTLRKKKVYDTKHRTEVINQQADAVVISIHQNSLPSSPKTHGAMVFYNTQEGSDAIAQRVQQALNETVNVGNGKNKAPIGKDVYIMAHAIHPAILVECGFLSNANDCANLQRNDYQVTLALSIVAGFLQEEESP